MLDAIKENPYYSPRIRMAIVMAKRLKRDELFVKDLESKLTVAISEERKQSEEENKEKFEEYQKQQEERKRKREIEEEEEERERKERKRKREIEEVERNENAQKSSIKKNWDLFFITHIDNLPHITKDGIVAPKIRPKYYKKIADEKLASIRNDKIIANSRLAAEYAHVYFRPDNAMLTAVLTRKGFRLNEIVIIRIKIDITEHELYMTDRNAYYYDSNDPRFIPSNRYMEIIPRIESMIKEDGWNQSCDEEMKKKFMAECHILYKFPLDSLKAICIADKQSIKNRGYNFAEFYDNVKSKISRGSILTEENIEERREFFFKGRYG